MIEFHRIPTMRGYLIWMVVASALAGFAPFLVCLNFGDGFFNNKISVNGACPLTLTTKLGQSGALIMYVSALLAVVPPLLYADKAAANRKIAKRLILRLEAQLKSERAARNTEAVQPTTEELSLVRRKMREAERYPAVAKVIAWFALALIFIGTLMQVVETGG